MKYEVFQQVREAYGTCASWAVWDQGACERLRYQPDPRVPSFFLNRAVKRLNAVNSQADLDGLGWELDPHVVLVALNFAERTGEVRDVVSRLNFHAFHEETTVTSDQRLRDACCGTPLWGGYITDLVKMHRGVVQPVRNSSAAEVARLLRSSEFRRDQINGLVAELQLLGCSDPLIVSLGNDVHRVLSSLSVTDRLKEICGQGTRVVKVTHYSRATGIRFSDYVHRVYQELANQSVL